MLLLLLQSSGGGGPTFKPAWCETDDDDGWYFMKKNVASQTVGRQMVSATDGSAFTGTVTVYVTGDNGTQALGSVGSGVCTHEGNGYHTYNPSQAETNYDKVAFTFIGSGAVPRTLEIWTSFPQTGDSFARIGAPVGASISADIAGVQADTDNIQTRLPTSLVSGRIDASVGAMAADVVTASAIAANAIGASELASDGVTEIADAVLRAALTESYNTDGAAPTLTQAVMLVLQMLTEATVAGTTLTVKKLDGSSTAATFTLNDATTPTSITRTT